MGFIKAGTVSDSVTADMILEALKKENIFSYKKDLGVGNYRRITCGYSQVGSEIYVEEESAQEAKEIIEMIGGSNEDESEDSYEDGDDELSEGNKKFHLRRTVFLLVWLFFIIAGVICLIVVGS